MEQKATYAALKGQIAKLQKDADELLKTERVAVINRIKEAVTVYALTARDLGLGKQLRKPRRKKNLEAAGQETPAKVARKPRPAKFSDGKGNEWSGRGEQPEWVKGALGAGQTLNDLKRKPAK
ncbi:H-NS histone family protein [Caenimonas aquaedulcis]|uniref:H-NS histone family protein n=1 Tax=Caenimonas aquaedulcis TaxID=2793270 RepID=A0A931MHP3_9BURK|nr:H-NS histone family protein [Caenimonas aquaedulcis]MBG9388385.1 H-NS histone family protein [Caenimonas aquaedulcis]